MKLLGYALLPLLLAVGTSTPIATAAGCGTKGYSVGERSVFMLTGGKEKSVTDSMNSKDWKDHYDQQYHEMMDTWNAAQAGDEEAQANFVEQYSTWNFEVKSAKEEGTLPKGWKEPGPLPEGVMPE
jgi:hypothetical protein